MWLQQQSRLKNIALALGVAMTFAVSGSGFAQQQTSNASAANQAVGGVSPLHWIATVVLAAAMVAAVSDNKQTTATTGTQ